MEPDSLTDQPLGGDDAEGDTGGSHLPGDQAQDGRQGEGRAHRAGKDRKGSSHRAQAERSQAISEAIGDEYEGPSKNGRKSKAEKAAENAVVASVVDGFKAPKNLGRRLNAKFKAMLAKRMELYRCDALDALHDLACMPMSSNAMLNQVKYLASLRLAGPAPNDQSAVPQEVDTALRQLQDDYTKAQPRIRSVRERVIEFEQPSLLVNGP